MLVFGMTLLETSCFIGLLLPAEATVLLAAFLANQGYFPIETVFVATFSGGFLGDQIGYGLGRFGGDRAAGSDSRIGRLWRRNEVRAHAMFRRQSLLAISAARFVSFVRTLMPWLAGMSRMRYRRYVIYDAIGVGAWASVSVALGYFAGESITAITNILGAASVIILGVAAFIAYKALKKRRENRETAIASGVARPVYRVGLTGNIGSGKSTVAEIWRGLGAHVVDADELARDAVKPGTPALAAVRARFGPEVIEPWGELNRAALRNVVFADDSARRDLEAIIHPEVERLRSESERNMPAGCDNIIVHMIPLLFETGMQDRFDEIVFVDAPDDVREARIVNTRHLSSEEARAMMAAQMSPDEKRDIADHVIDNAGDMNELTERATLIWRGILERACE
jgi:dephospho-CoA kinase